MVVYDVYDVCDDDDDDDDGGGGGGDDDNVGEIVWDSMSNNGEKGNLFDP